MSVPEPAADGYRYYNQWSGNPRGRREDKGCCVVEVYSGIAQTHQCSRKRGSGPDGLYCKQHDPAVAASRAAASRAEYQRKADASGGPYRRLDAARKVLEEIAGGHSDARGLATDLLRRWNEI